MKENGNLTSRAARWGAAHRRRVVLGWLVFVIVAFAAGAAAGMVTLTQVEAENGQSRLADETQASQFPHERAGEQVLVENPGGPLAATDYRTAITDLVAQLSHTPSVTSIRSPLDPSNPGQLSRDGRAALVTFQIAGNPDTSQKRVAPALAATAAVQRAHPDLFIGELGTASVNKAVYDLINHDFRRAELTLVPVTLLILVLAFGALAAAGVPMVLGFTAVAAALGLTDLLSHLLHVEQSITSVILLIGLAVGIDYSLFYVRRAREERAAGQAPGQALQAAAATSGRAVLISGFTVAIAMMGMFMVGNQVFTSFGMGTVLVVLVALAGSLTVLPAVLAGLGDWNWYLPRWLQWLPRVRTDAVAGAAVMPAPPPRRERAVPPAGARR